MTLANRYSVMVLFSDIEEHLSHRIRIVMAEKDISHIIEYVDLKHPQKEFLRLNPYKILKINSHKFYDTAIIRDIFYLYNHLLQEQFDFLYPALCLFLLLIFPPL